MTVSEARDTAEAIAVMRRINAAAAEILARAAAAPAAGSPANPAQTSTDSTTHSKEQP